MKLLLFVSTLVLLVPTTLAFGAEESPKGAESPPPSISVFQYPARAETANQLMRIAIMRAAAGELPDALKLCQQCVDIAPFLPEAHYNLACMLALSKESDKALDALSRAIELGFFDVKQLEKDDDLKSLRDSQRFSMLIALAKNPERLKKQTATNSSTAVRDGVAMVSQANSFWDQESGLVRVQFEVPSPKDVESAEKPQAVVEGFGEIGKKLTEWFRAGTAAGNIGDFYDNCDRDHSNMRRQSFPQLAFIEYAPEIAKETGYGLQVSRIYNGVVIGNSSTAQTAGPYWRSNPRAAYTNARFASVLAFQYAHNHLYFYPEHRDHDPGHNGQDQGFGDVYPANTPYVVISQGSSGSDQAFLNGFACTLAAFHPSVKKKLAEERAIVPTLQMIFRRTGKQLKLPDDYFTGIAHPTVFDSKFLDVAAMTEMAHAMTLATLPPIAQLQVVEEDQPVLGRDYFDAGPRERLFDTPAAVARIWRSTAKKRRFVLSAKGSRDLTNRPLKFRWALLRGDARGVEIKPLDDAGLQAEIVFTWQSRRPVVEDSKMESNRIDVGLFADNGTQVSAPAFFCINTLDNETREYDDAGKIRSVTYRGPSDKGNYVDPAFDLPKSWTDQYRYSADGKLLGWSRKRGEQAEEFTADGALVEKRDSLGRAEVARTVRYVPQATKPNQQPVLQQLLADERLFYVYAAADDSIGKIERREKVITEQ